MTRAELITALKDLLAAHADLYGDYDPAPPLGNQLEPKLAAMRRLLTGQILGISPRVVREIVRELESQ